LPLAARSQHVEDRVGTISIGHARPSPAKAMGVDVDGQQRLEHGPQLVEPHYDIVGEFKKWGKIPQKRSFFSSRWGISTTFGA